MSFLQGCKLPPSFLAKQVPFLLVAMDASQPDTLINLLHPQIQKFGRSEGTLKCAHSVEMLNPPLGRPPFTPLPIPHKADIQVHTAPDGSQWVQNGIEWVRYDAHPLLQQMDVDSPRPVENPYPPTQPPVQGHRYPDQYNFSMRPASTSAGPSTTTYASTSRVPDMLIDPHLRPVPDIDPRLYPLPNDFDFDLTDPATVAKARGLVPAKKVAGSRRSSKAMSGKGKKRARESSESDDSNDDAPVAKRGRPSGAANYSKEDVQALFGFIEKELPLGQRGWKAVHGHYTKYRRANKCPKCSIKSLESKYKQYLKLKKPTGSGVCPPEVKRAHALEAHINEHAGTRDVSDFDLNDSTSGESSDDDVETRSNSTPSSFERARDEERYHRSAENTQVFTLSQQLQDVHTSAETLRNQISILQQHLNDAERARDIALLKSFPAPPLSKSPQDLL
ncbi:hypothetical protein C8R44DRAFT_873467 [Mycena epipterygia]|nr:hypothetical protein C8R44DRAFT_873467 [Mycena epipterygia]